MGSGSRQRPRMLPSLAACSLLGLILILTMGTPPAGIGAVGPSALADKGCHHDPIAGTLGPRVLPRRDASEAGSDDRQATAIAVAEVRVAYPPNRAIGLRANTSAALLPLQDLYLITQRLRI